MQADLQRLRERCIAEEVASALRHRITNKLCGIQGAVSYLRLRVEGEAPMLLADPTVSQFFELVDAEVASATQLMSPLSGEATGASGTDAGRDPWDPAALLATLAAATPVPGTVKLLLAPSGTRLPRLTVALDEVRLALACLVENAVEAVAEGGGGTVRVELGLRAGAGPERVSFEVTDDGPGFGSLGVDRAMLPFASTKAGRLGLGLCIARRLAYRAGGSLEVQALSPRGASQRLSLLAAQPAAAAPAPSGGPSPSRASPPAAPPPASAPATRARILLVDDSEAAALTVGALLERAGHQVTHVSSLAEARQQLTRAEFDVAMVDYHLGDGLGTLLIDELRRVHPRMLIALWTGESFTEVPDGPDLLLSKAEDPDGEVRRLGQAWYTHPERSRC